MAEEKPPNAAPEPGGEKRLEELEDRLEKARESSGPGRWRLLRKSERPSGPLGLALRVAVELVSALAVGVGIGWLLDEWLGTRPWLMLVFILLGGAAGILNVYRLASGFGDTVGYRKPGEKNETPEERGEDDRGRSP